MPQRTTINKIKENNEIKMTAGQLITKKDINNIEEINRISRGDKL